MSAPTSRVIGDYILGPRIGSGSFSVVWRSRNRRTGDEVAVKEIAKGNLSLKLRDSVIKEISILRGASHPNIVRLHEVIETEDRIYIVLEYCAGGDLGVFIQQRGRVSDGVARGLMRQLASGLRFLWENNLIHRDLKPQNLLLSTNGEGSVLKIGDFGFARYIKPQDLAETLCGSPLYMAPEIIENKRYDSKADLWSVGAILFQLVTGKPPFDGNCQLQLFQNILASNELQFPQDVLAGLHPDCIDLCRSLLRRNPVERLAFNSFFSHKFLALPRTSEPETMRNTTDGNLGKTIDVSSSASSHIQSMKTGSMDHGFLNTSAPKVFDSFESIEREYVIVNARFASMDLLPSSLEMSAQESSTRLPSCIHNKVRMSTASLMQTGEPPSPAASLVESTRDSVSTSSLVPQASNESEEVHATSSSDPRRRLGYLYNYVYALTKIAQEKLNVGLHLESFSVELVILAIWKEALQVCNSWTTSTSEIDDKYRSFLPKDEQSSVESEGSFDIRNPSSICAWARREFLVAYDRTEKLSNSFQDIKGTMEMPYAMEIIFQTGLLAGKSGAVDQLMGHMSRAMAWYSRAMTLLSFIMEEAQSLPLNPPFVLSPNDRKRIRKYVLSLRAHLKQCQMEDSATKLTESLLSR